MSKHCSFLANEIFDRLGRYQLNIYILGTSIMLSSAQTGDHSVSLSCTWNTLQTDTMALYKIGKDLDAARPAFNLVNHSRRLPALLEIFLGKVLKLLMNECNATSIFYR